MIHLKNILFGAVILLLASFTFFHHGWSNYDQTKELDFTSTIEESTYENPHALIKVKYEAETWTVYLAPTSRMTSRGLSADAIKEGTEVRLVAYPHKTDKGEMRAESIYVDGEKYELR
jgi:hypothetical protein